jgi:hypothetical protein
VANFQKAWSPIEVEVCEMLVDDALNDPHHFRDFLVEHGIDPEGGQPFGHDRDDDPSFRTIRSATSYLNGELSSNEAIFPSALIRKGRYPLIRQMRDVHQFDVGSHLALCYLIARRNGPGVAAHRAGLPHLAAALDEFYQETNSSELELGAVFHDYFKAFRSRRGLPSKLGPALTPAWFLPDGSSPPESALEEEGEIAALLLPDLAQVDDETIARVAGAIQLSSKWGSALYRLLNYEREGAENVAGKTLGGFAEKDSRSGMYLGIVDWLGKGWALDVLTVRKERKLTLREAGLIAMTAVDGMLQP